MWKFWRFLDELHRPYWRFVAPIALYQMALLAWVLVSADFVPEALLLQILGLLLTLVQVLRPSVWKRLWRIRREG